MYLTRMRLNPAKRSTMQALAEPKMFHGAIERGMTGERGRALWRIDPLGDAKYLMIVSGQRPDLTAAVQQFGYPDADPAWETRDYMPLLQRITPGSRWHFRLTANPTKHLPGCAESGKRGKIVPHITAAHQQAWLKEKAAQHGFALTEGEFLAVGTQWYQFRKPQEGNRPVSLLSVTFEGLLTVTDADQFRRALTEGVGRGKAYGMGMMTIVRAVEAL